MEFPKTPEECEKYGDDVECGCEDCTGGNNFKICKVFKDKDTDIEDWRK